MEFGNGYSVQNALQIRDIVSRSNDDLIQRKLLYQSKPVESEIDLEELSEDIVSNAGGGIEDIEPDINLGTSAYEHKKAQLEEVGKSFEQIFINMMLKSMRSSLDKESDILHGGFSQDIFEDMLYEKYAEHMADSDFMNLDKTIVSRYESYL